MYHNFNIRNFKNKWRSISLSILLSFLVSININAQTENTLHHQIDSLNKTVNSGTLTQEQVGIAFLNIAQKYEQLDSIEETIIHYNKALNVFKGTNNKLYQIKVYIELGITHHLQNKFDKALECFYAAYEILPHAKTSLSDNEYKLYNGIILLDISIIFAEVKYYDAALQYATKANGILSNLDSTNIASSSSILGTIYLGLNQVNLAKQYLNKSLEYYGTNSIPDNFISTTYKNLGSSYLEEKDYEQALSYYQKAMDFYNLHPDLYKSERAGVFADIARAYAENGDIIKAMHNLDLALNLANENNGDRYIEDIYESLVELYTVLDNPVKALESLKTLSTIRDSLYNHEILENIINIQREYDQKKISEENDLQIRLLQQEQTITKYRWYVILGILMILVLIMLLVFFRQRYKITFNKIELKNIKLEQEQLADKLKFKNKELTNFAMYIVERNEILNKIKNQINELKSNSDPQITQLSIFMNQHLDSFSDSKDFELRIENEYQDFHYKLEKLFPGLTEKDKKLCSLLLLDLSSKDIASILNIESSSVDKSRYRLRKKIGIESDISFSAYLKSL